MQEWLKNKKNLPIVVALTVVMLLVAGGVVGLEAGLFDSKPTPIQAQQSIPSGPPTAVSGPSYAGRPSPRLSSPGLPAARRPGLPAGLPQGGPGAAATAAVTPKSDIVNPLVGPDPFSIPGGAQKAAKARLVAAGPKPQLRTVVGPLDLFRIHPPAPPALPIVAEGGGTQSGPNPAAHIRLSGLINGPDGSNAILEVDGQSQSAKPGDTLADGTNVQSIQATSVTLKSSTGSVFILPLSAGTPDQGTVPFNGQPQYPGGFNSQPQVY